MTAPITTAIKPPCGYCGMWHGPRCPAREEAAREIERLRTVRARIAGPWEQDDELTDLSARMRQAATEGLT